MNQVTEISKFIGVSQLDGLQYRFILAAAPLLFSFNQQLQQFFSS